MKIIALAWILSSAAEASDEKLRDIYKLFDHSVKVGLDEDTSHLSLVIKNKNSKRIIFESPQHISPIEAILSNSKLKMTRGSFLRSFKRIKTCSKVKVNSSYSTKEVVTLVGEFIGCELGFKLSIYEDGRDNISISSELTPVKPPVLGASEWTARLNWKSSEDEKMIGFGEQFTRVNMKGSVLPIISSEQGHGRSAIKPNGLWNRVSGGGVGAWYSSYASVPQYISNKNYSLYSSNYEYMEFDFSRKKRSSLEIQSLNLDISIISRDKPLELIREYTRFSGRMKALPDWAHKGPIIALMGGSKQVAEQVRKLDESAVPYSSLWIQDWPGVRKTPVGERVWWHWEVDRTHYPDWEEIVGHYKKNDVPLMSYINPFLVEVDSNTNFEENYLEHAKEKDFLLKDKNGDIVWVGQVGYRAALLDLSHPEAVYFIKKMIKKEIIDKGIKGWMADFSEAVPFTVVPFNKMSGKKYHHWYIEQWARINREVITDLGLEGEAIFMMRAGHSRSPRYNTLAWVGDQLVTWDEHDGLKSSLRALISSGISGFSINHSDIGGAIEFNVLNILKFKRTKELMHRWIELNAFTPVMRTHVGIAGEKSGHQIYSSKETLDFFAKFSRVFASLKPYRDNLMYEAENRGYPMIRHMALEFPDDEICWDLVDQYMFGSDMLVAPVMDPNKQKAKAYLPRGKWVHIWSGNLFDLKQGRWIEDIDAPLGMPPVFVKKGSLVEVLLKAYVL